MADDCAVDAISKPDVLKQTDPVPLPQNPGGITRLGCIFAFGKFWRLCFLEVLNPLQETGEMLRAKHPNVKLFVDSALGLRKFYNGNYNARKLAVGKMIFSIL